MFLPVMIGHRRARFASLAGFLAIVPSLAGAQDPVSNLGLPAVAGFGFHAGFARLERHSKGREAGLLVDVGWMRGRSVRLQAEASLVSASLTETLVLEDSTQQTFTGDYYATSAGVSGIWLVNPDARVSPYALAGVAVHALSSKFGNSVLDQRYNANRFGSHIGAGIRIRVGSRPVLYAETRRIISDEVNRTVVRFGGLVLFGDLYRNTARSR